MQVPTRPLKTSAEPSVARPMPSSSVIGFKNTAKAKFEMTPVLTISAMTAPNTIHQRLRNMPFVSMRLGSSLVALGSPDPVSRAFRMPRYGIEHEPDRDA